MSILKYEMKQIHQGLGAAVEALDLCRVCYQQCRGLVGVYHKQASNCFYHCFHSLIYQMTDAEIFIVCLVRYCTPYLKRLYKLILVLKLYTVKWTNFKNQYFTVLFYTTNFPHFTLTFFSTSHFMVVYKKKCKQYYKSSGRTLLQKMFLVALTTKIDLSFCLQYIGSNWEEPLKYRKHIAGFFNL